MAFAVAFICLAGMALALFARCYYVPSRTNAALSKVRGTTEPAPTMASSQAARHYRTALAGRQASNAGGHQDRRRSRLAVVRRAQLVGVGAWGSKFAAAQARGVNCSRCRASANGHSALACILRRRSAPADCRPRLMSLTSRRATGGHAGGRRGGRGPVRAPLPHYCWSVP